MSNVMRSFVAAFGLAALTSASSAQSAYKLPSSVCALDAKGVATIYTRVEANEFRPDVRSEGAVKRSVSVFEDIDNAIQATRINGRKPSPIIPVVGVKGDYSASSKMYLVNEGQWASRYAGAITVSITGWEGKQALGKCFEQSTNSPDPLNEAPIIDAGKLPIISTGRTRLERYVEPAPKR